MAGKSRVTLKDIAAECGVSVMTVSRVLRKQRHVKKEVRKEVEAAAKRLDYRPDPALAALIRHRRKAHEGESTGEQLALVVPEDQEFGWGKFPILTDLEADMKNEAARLGYRMQRIGIPADTQSLEATLRRLYTKGIRGLMLAPALDISGIPLATWEDFVVVTLEPGAFRVPFHAIRNDFFQMAECAVEAFHRMGHRKIAYVTGPIDSYTQYRAVGALAACMEYLEDLQTSTFRVPEWTPTPPKGYTSWLRKFRPTALISMSTWISHWYAEWKAKDKPAIDFAQINRPRWDRTIHGVCTAPGVHGTAIIQRLHQLLLDDERGTPKARTILRIDGYWERAANGMHPMESPEE